ncbi:hypothetical protein Bbelb_245270 [Branchiostoma belcheri]|nr:hypothetical protein Bbelb_245270 [Branchiostoma belcheri]
MAFSTKDRARRHGQCAYLEAPYNDPWEIGCSPEIKDKWPQLRQLTEDEMRSSPYLQKLSVRILSAMDHVVDSLDDPDYLIPELKKLGQMHADMTNPIILPEDLWKLEGPFLAAVGTVMEDRFTRKYQDIYQKFIIFVLETIVIGFDPH